MRFILFKSPLDAQKIVFIGRQIKIRMFFKDCVELAIRKQFGYKLVDLDQNTFVVLPHGSKIGPPGSSKFYLP